MAKITPIVVSPNLGFDNGQTSAAKINEAMKTVEVGAGLSGNGSEESPINFSDFESVKFNTDPPIITDAGTVQWNNKEYTINVNTGLGATIQVGLETLILFYNDTGLTVDNFSVMHLKSGVDVSGYLYKTFELAIASDHEKCQGTLAIATHVIPDGQLGFLTQHGDASDGDTSALTAGGQNWLSATQAGKITSVKPEFPDYPISLGGAYNSSLTGGKIWVNILGSVNDTFNEAWDGAIRESFNFIVGSINGVILGELKNVDPTLNLTLIFSDVGLYTFDTTSTDVAIQLTAGTDELTVTNFVFIPMTTKLLTVSVSGFPDAEHCKVAVIECQSAANIELRGGARGNQNVNDHIKKETNNGHVLHITEWIRRQFATHISGAEATLSVGDLPNGYIGVTGGQVSQLHEQTTQVLTMPTNLIMVANDPDVPYREIDNLNQITKFSDGSNWNDDWGKVVVWLIANKTGQPDFLCVNLPRDGENDSAKALLDEKQKANYSIPVKYKSKAILLGAFSIDITNGDVDYTGAATGYQDLRGTIPSNIAGGGGGGGVTSLLALDDVSIASYVGKKRQKVVVNDLETGVDSVEDGVFIKNDLDTPDTNTLDLLLNDYYTKITTVGLLQSFVITNEKLTYFKLELTGGTLATTLFTHATKTVTINWEGGALEQYDPLLTNRLRFEIERITPNIVMSGSIVNSENAGYYGEYRNTDVPTAIVDLNAAERFPYTCGTLQQFEMQNELTKFFQLALEGGTLNTTLFTHATKTVTLAFENGALEQYEPTELNNLYCYITEVTGSDIFVTATLVNDSNQIPSELTDGSDASSLHNHDSAYLNKTNTTTFEPTADYHPATKKYVDENAGGGTDIIRFNQEVTANTTLATQCPAGYEVSCIIAEHISGVGVSDLGVQFGNPNFQAITDTTGVSASSDSKLPFITSTSTYPFDVKAPIGIDVFASNWNSATVKIYVTLLKVK